MYFRGLLLQINEARMYVAELAIDLAAAADNNAGGRPRLSPRPVQGPFLPCLDTSSLRLPNSQRSDALAERRDRCGAKLQNVIATYQRVLVSADMANERH